MYAHARTMTVDDYLEGSKTSEVRHEWVDGDLWAMTGGSPRHAAVTANLIAALAVVLRGSPCRPTSSDQRVHVVATESWLYPDVTVVCGPYHTAPDDPRSVVNPTVLVEVLSPSTQSYDRRLKFEHYRQIPTVRDVLWVDPERPAVVHHARTEEGWLRRDFTTGTVSLTGLPGVTLSFDEIYADLENVPAMADLPKGKAEPG